MFFSRDKIQFIFLHTDIVAIIAGLNITLVAEEIITLDLQHNYSLFTIQKIKTNNNPHLLK